MQNQQIKFVLRADDIGCTGLNPTRDTNVSLQFSLWWCVLMAAWLTFQESCQLSVRITVSQSVKEKRKKKNINSKTWVHLSELINTLKKERAREFGGGGGKRTAGYD
jgi:hypothetical protein